MVGALAQLHRCVLYIGTGLHYSLGLYILHLIGALGLEP